LNCNMLIYPAGHKLAYAACLIKCSQMSWRKRRANMDKSEKA